VFIHKARQLILSSWLPLIASTLLAQPNHWSDPVNISHTSGGSSFPAMAIGSDGVIHVVWEDDSRLSNPWMNDILYASGDGIQWSDPVQLSGMDTTFSFLPRIAVDSEGRPHVVWNHHAIFPDGAIYYTTLTDSGWTEPLNLTPWNSTRYAPDIAIDGNGLIHVIWTDYIFGNGEIVHSYFDGEAWSPIENVSNDSLDSGRPRIAIDEQDHLHVAWMNYAWIGIACEIYYSSYDGNSWSPELNISLSDTMDSTDPDLTLDPDGNPNIVWSQVTAYNPVVEEILYRCFNGLIWSSVQNLTNLGLRTAGYPQIAISSQGIECVFFCLSRDYGDPYVNYMYCIDSRWSYPDSIWGEEYMGGMSAIAVNDDDIFHGCISTGFGGVSDIGYACNESFSQVVTDPIPIISIQPAFSIYPNPHNSIAKIQYDLPLNSETSLYIYDAKGQLISELQNGNQIAGVHEELWDGTNQLGKEVSAGIYFVRLLLDGRPITQKLVLLK